MKIGFNLLLWTSHVERQHWPILADLKACGYDGVEIPIFEGTPAHYAELGKELDRLGLERTVIALFPTTETDPIGADAAQRQAALDHMNWILECSAALGAATVGGPLHSALGHFSGVAPTAAERARGVAFHREAGEIARRHGIIIALEALNRFECYFLNTMADLASYLAEVGHPNVLGMYDTFHANIEEKDPVAAIHAIAPHLGHVHVSENDRGTPGKGHIDFAATFAALRKVDYDGWITIEAFGRALPPLAAATRVWRDLSPTPTEVYIDGFKLIRDGWHGGARTVG
ncbi:MAG TPA: sugar phosphate isomerase/epimerase [Pararhizobium sp.]|nr:sugar phosphate isomerase/epimerase [Pararhizobium sp.]